MNNRLAVVTTRLFDRSRERFARLLAVNDAEILLLRLAIAVMRAGSKAYRCIRLDQPEVGRLWLREIAAQATMLMLCGSPTPISLAAWEPSYNADDLLDCCTELAACALSDEWDEALAAFHYKRLIGTLSVAAQVAFAIEPDDLWGGLWPTEASA